jgi:hypothetical protein
MDLFLYLSSAFLLFPVLSLALLFVVQAVLNTFKKNRQLQRERVAYWTRARRRRHF